MGAKAWMLALALAACSGETITPPVEVAPVPVAPAAPGAAPAAEAPKADTWRLPEGANPALTKPELVSETAPAKFKVAFETTKGTFVVQVHRDWAPVGADRFYNLVKIGFYDQCKFFRNLEGFMVQFGISGYPEVAAAWGEAQMKDDPVKETNSPGRITYAKTGMPNSRSTQLFINHGNNAGLDRDGFAPFGEVVEGMDVVGQLFSGYGEGAPRGGGPAQDRLVSKGNAYLEASFPKLDGIIKATVVP